MADKAAARSPRIAELSRRLQREPGSRAFLELAREYHSVGAFDDAARVCRDGLAKHPAYHSARVLLGRTLIDQKQFGEAKLELDKVVQLAPDNLLARRLLADALFGAGEVDGSLETLRALLKLAPEEHEIEDKIREIESARTKASPPSPQEQREPTPATPAEVAEALPQDVESPPAGLETLPSLQREAVGVGAPQEPASRAAVGESGGGPPPPDRSLAAQAPSSPQSAPRDEDREETVALFEGVGETGVGIDSAAAPLAEARAEPQPAPLAGVEAKAEAGSEAEREAEPADLPPTATIRVLPEPSESVEAIPTLTLADLYLQQGMPAKALSVCERILEIDPGNEQARAQLAELRGLAGVGLAPEPSPAPEVAALPAASESPGPLAGVQETAGVIATPTLAEIMVARGEPERALAVYQEVLRGDPHNEEILARVRDLEKRTATSAAPEDPRIRALQDWLQRVRRVHHVQTDARGSRAPTAGM